MHSQANTMVDNQPMQEALQERNLNALYESWGQPELGPPPAVQQPL